jgi:hypothetical protein
MNGLHDKRLRIAYANVGLVIPISSGNARPTTAKHACSFSTRLLIGVRLYSFPADQLLLVRADALDMFNLRFSQS